MTELEKKEAAINTIKEAAKDAAELYFAKNAKDLVSKGLDSEEAKSAMSDIAQKALESLNVKDVDGKDIALKTLVSELNDQAQKMAARIKAIEDGSVVATPSFEKELANELKSRLSDLRSLKTNSKASINFDIKAAATMLISSNYTGGTVGLTSWDSQVARAPRRQPFMRELVRVLPTDNMYIAWAEIKNPDPGVAGTVAEGAAKPQTDFDIVEATAKVEKIAVWIKVSKEALDDIKFLQAEINTELRELVELKLDEQILSGDGVSPNLEGILEYAPAFNAGSFAASIPFANAYDVIVAAIAQIGASNFNPTAVVVNPVDYYKLMLTKDANGNYIRPQFMADGSYVIAGLRVVANNGVTAGTFLVGDFSKSNLAIREELNIDIGYVNDDFTKNLVTILAEMRAVHYIKSNHVNAFVQGSFADAIDDILLPAAEPEA